MIRKIKYSDIPVQAKIKETLADGSTQIFGAIIYLDKVIAMDNGNELDLNADWIEVIEELPWINLSEEVLGE